MLTLFVFVISFILLFGDYALLNDIVKEYKLGWEIKNEWTILYALFFVHGIFHLLMFFLIIKSFNRLRHTDRSESVVKDEIIFNIAQYVGVFCGFIGLIWTFSSIFFHPAPHLLKKTIVFNCILIFAPYGVIAFYWLMMKLKDKPSDWYDEKQWQDITKASLASMVLSIPLMTLFFLLNYQWIQISNSLAWFPYYFFLILLMFSGSTIYFSKKG